MTIYKIAIPEKATTLFKSDTVVAQKIEFSYEDQKEFPPPSASKHFNAEAMIATPDSIYVFTKDFDAVPYTGKTHIYRLPTVAGKYVAHLVHIWDTDKSWKYNGSITAAALSSDSKLLLMSYQKLWVFTDFPKQQFWLGNKKEFVFGFNQFAQYEAVAIAPWDNCTVFMTSELRKGLGGSLTTFNLCDILSKAKSSKTVKAAIPKGKKP